MCLTEGKLVMDDPATDWALFGHVLPELRVVTVGILVLALFFITI